MSQGKALIDYNHPLAGKKLSFTITVREKIIGKEAQIRTLIQRRIPGHPPGLIKLEFSDNDPKKLTIIMPNTVLFVKSPLYYIKTGIALDMKDHHGFEKILFVYDFDLSKKETSADTTEEENKEENKE